MRRIAIISLAVFGLSIFGCKKDGPEAADPNSPADPTAAAVPGAPNPGQNPNAAPAGGGSNSSVNITPMGGVGAGPMTPVAGAEGVQGGGSAAGQVLKDRARGLAGQSPSSINQMSGDDN